MIMLIVLTLFTIALFMPTYIRTIGNNEEYLEWVYVAVPLWKALYMIRNNNTAIVSKLSYLHKEDYGYH